jgi:hypothetical protein
MGTLPGSNADTARLHWSRAGYLTCVDFFPMQEPLMSFLHLNAHPVGM